MRGAAVFPFLFALTLAITGGAAAGSAPPAGATVAPAAVAADAYSAATNTSADAVGPSGDSGLLPGFRFGRYDLLFFAATAVAVGITMNHDVEITRQVRASDSDASHRLAGWVQPLGNPAVLVSATALVWGAGHLAHAPGLTAAAARTGVAIVAAGTGALVIKESVGRWRPRESPDDALRFDPFSSHDGFPSGHTTLAFATATALDRETTTRWVPAIAYPIAALVGWSRIHDNEHWTSDVIAGAALGFWTAGKAEDVMRARERRGTRASLRIVPGPEGACAVYRVRF